MKMPRWLIIIINVLGSLFFIILNGTIYYLKCGTVTFKVRFFFILCSGKEKIQNSLKSRSAQVETCKTGTSLTNLMSMTVPLKTIDRPTQGTPVPMMKNATIHYTSEADKAAISFVTSEQHCLEHISLDSSKYDKFRAHRHKNRNFNIE